MQKDNRKNNMKDTHTHKFNTELLRDPRLYSNRTENKELAKTEHTLRAMLRHIKKRSRFGKSHLTS